MSSLSLVEFADRVSEIMPEIMKEFARQQTGELVKARITLPQLMILLILQKEGEMKMSGLSRAMNVTTAAMTGIVDRLVREGYLVRAYDSRDRRIIKVRLTAKGGQLAKKLGEERRRMVIQVFRKLPESDRAEYLKILKKIKEVLIREGPGIK